MESRLGQGSVLASVSALLRYQQLRVSALSSGTSEEKQSQVSEIRDWARLASQLLPDSNAHTKPLGGYTASSSSKDVVPESLASQLHPNINAYTKPLDGYTAFSSSNDAVPGYGPSPDFQYGKSVNEGTPAELNAGDLLFEMDADGTARR